MPSLATKLPGFFAPVVADKKVTKLCHISIGPRKVKNYTARERILLCMLFESLPYT